MEAGKALEKPSGEMEPEVRVNEWEGSVLLPKNQALPLQMGSDSPTWSVRLQPRPCRNVNESRK